MKVVGDKACAGSLNFMRAWFYGLAGAGLGDDGGIFRFNRDGTKCFFAGFDDFGNACDCASCADGGPSNSTANGGGILVEGGTDGDKTLTWASTGSTWSSSENFNLATNKTYRIAGFDVLSQTSLGTTVASAPGLTSVGTLTSLQVSNLNISGTTVSSTTPNANIILSPNGSGTVSMNNAKISNLGTPTDPAHGANKSYVDYTVRIASLGLSADTTGLTPAQIATGILAKIFPPTDHESGTKLRLICTDKPELGTDLNSRYKQFNLTPTVGDTKEWQYGGPL